MEARDLYQGGMKIVSCYQFGKADTADWLAGEAAGVQHDLLLREGTLPVVPAAVLAQVWRGGRQARLAMAYAFARRKIPLSLLQLLYGVTQQVLATIETSARI